MNRRKYLLLTILGVCCGTALSFTYINPYTSQISLSELILQLSGARGVFTLGISLTELLSYSAKIVPYLLFEIYIGVNLYRHFCTASVYVFSRTPNRVLWYVRECVSIIIAIIIYQASLLISAIVTAWYRYEIVWDVPGVKILIVHALLYALWLFAMTLLVNLLSIGFGSEVAFAITFGGQVILIVLQASLRLLENSGKIYSFILNVNPMSHLVIGWHSAAIEWTGYLIPGIDGSLSLSSSFIYISSIAIAAGAAGVVCIKRRDLIAADSEFGGF